MLPVYAHMNGAFSIVYRLPKHRRIWMVYVISAHTNGGNVFFSNWNVVFIFHCPLRQYTYVISAHTNGGLYIVYRLPKHTHIRMAGVIYARIKVHVAYVYWLYMPIWNTHTHTHTHINGGYRLYKKIERSNC